MKYEGVSGQKQQWLIRLTTNFVIRSDYLILHLLAGNP